jgi:hypothetical protein
MTQTQSDNPTRAPIGLSVMHRRYVPYNHAHYAGDLVDGAYTLGLFGDLATDMCLQTDGDEGLLAAPTQKIERFKLAERVLGHRTWDADKARRADSHHPREDRQPGKLVPTTRGNAPPKTRST